MSSDTDSTKINTVTIPTRSIWSAVGLVCLAAFSYLQFVGYIIPGLVEMAELKPETSTVLNIGLIWIPIVIHLLITCNICLAINIFKPLKFPDPNSLISHFSAQLIGLLATILFFAFAFKNQLWVPSIGLVEDLMLGYSVLFIVGLFIGLKREFT